MARGAAANPLSAGWCLRGAGWPLPGRRDVLPDRTEQSPALNAAPPAQRVCPPALSAPVCLRVRPSDRRPEKPVPRAGPSSLQNDGVPPYPNGGFNCTRRSQPGARNCRGRRHTALRRAPAGRDSRSRRQASRRAGRRPGLPAPAARWGRRFPQPPGPTERYRACAAPRGAPPPGPPAAAAPYGGTAHPRRPLCGCAVLAHAARPQLPERTAPPSPAPPPPARPVV